jgi:hypothetical protein
MPNCAYVPAAVTPHAQTKQRDRADSDRNSETLSRPKKAGFLVRATVTHSCAANILAVSHDQTEQWASKTESEIFKQLDTRRV